MNNTESFRRSLWFVSIDGQDLTSTFDPVLMSMTISDKDGGKSDTLDLEFDDRGGRILLPRSGADVVARIGWQGGGAVSFAGKTDEPHSRGARGGGMVLSLTAHSADPKGKGKETQRRHKDNASFVDVARDWGGKAGYTVSVDPALAAITRDYWHIDESFHAWGARVARDLGATFKIRGDKATFIARGSGSAASGAQLAGVIATGGPGGNIISWDLTPSLGRMEYTAFKTRWYDPKSATWKTETVDVENADGAQAALTDRFKHASQDRAKARAQSNKDEADRKKGGGTLILDGEPAAVSQAPCTVSGVRDGIDGTYRITSAAHTRDRGRGYTTRVSIEQPGGSAGKDGRAKGAAATHAPGNQEAGAISAGAPVG